MPAFSKKSLGMLQQCHPDLQKVMMEAINSKHIHKYCKEIDKKCSFAIDVVPYPVNYNDRERFCLLAGIVLGIAKVLKDRGIIKSDIRWGGDWNRNNITKDESFSDLPHFEIL